jgi:hypothetical protein
MFGALNWIAHWYHSRGGLTVDELTDECVQFFLRTPAPRRRSRRSA